MDGAGDGTRPSDIEDDGEQRSNLNISDVFEAISSADPSFQPRTTGVADVAVPAAPGDMYSAAPAVSPQPDQRPYVRILEQPASKALRFRYECEGRSAGSIPGAHSSPENKTFPTIEIVGHKGRAVVVVSCVTKDKPYKPHPHNLVGRDLCKNGVCTVNAQPENMVVSFSNLGIQCVKKKDIEEALRIRESIRVDPFKTGFAHKSQAQGIDLNAVRLCFQVFLEHGGKIRHALQPIVSDIIYDKKAMNDLVITRLSHCSAPVMGGKQVILLCEKVAKEDIAVTFFEKASPGGAVSWQADAVDLFVHKQVAICFTTPRYHNIHVTDHVQVYIQLRRPTDNERSEALPFELIPMTSAGTKRKRTADLSFISRLLVDNKRDSLTDGNNNDELAVKTEKTLLDSRDSSADSCSVNVSDESGSANIADVSNGTLSDKETLAADDANEKSLNELLDQVAELDEIYSENRTRLENVSTLARVDSDVDDFNDAGTYTSLQLAFKNPVTITEPELEPFSYEDVQTYRGPIIEFTALKQDDDDRAPPLPPKRVRKAPSVEALKTNQTSVESLLKPGRQLPLSRNKDYLNDTREPSVARSEPALPPAPKKRSFLSRLFRRKDKSPKPEEQKETRGKPVGRSVSSVSGQRPSKFKSAVSHTSLKDTASTAGLSYADSITHISLHGDGDERTASQNSLKRPASLAPIPPTDDGTILVAESVLALDASAFKKLQDDLDLTDAEHYALYMAVAPHATVSEFDETSCYYSPIDGNPHYLKRKRQKPLSDFNEYAQPDRDMNPPMSEYYDIMAMSRDAKIKLEPRDKTPPHAMSSPPGAMSMGVYHNLGASSPRTLHEQARSPTQITHMDHYQQWNPQLDNVNLSVPGPSHLGPPFTPQDMSWAPVMGHVSPNMGHVSPNMGHMSPNMGHVSPNMGQMSPNMNQMVPSMTQLSNMSQMSPNLAQQPPILSQLGESSLMETGSNSSPSLSRLLCGTDCGDVIQLNSTELSGLSNFLDSDKPDQLSDSLNRLSTSDLLPRTNL